MPTLVPGQQSPESLETLAEHAQDFLESAGETIRQVTDAVSAAEQEGAAVLAAIRDGAEPPIERGPSIGRGGVGEVHLAEQRSMGRWVALKVLQPEHVDERLRFDLLREGWVTGMLEHPNIVPVYDVGVDGSGTPFLMMKRIEGKSWRDWMYGPGPIEQRFGIDPLEWNLRTLMAVCNAVHYAHSRFLLHRDLKPANVMIGAFGEVYVVDWGLALALEGGDARIPSASRVKAIAGTPAYMAPEMLARGPFDARTDVYLLGGILCEILAGQPPHTGDSLPEMADSIRRSQPVLPDEAPEALATLCRSAMAADPSRRPESAEAFRVVVQQFLRDRGAAALEVEAQSKLRGLAQAIGATEPNRIQIYSLFSACRFGFRQALAASPGLARARVGLVEAAERMIRYELDAGNQQLAAALVAEHPEVVRTLREEVEEAVASAEKHSRALERLRAVHDPMIERRARLGFALVMTGLWACAPLLIAIPLDRLVSHGPSHLGFTVYTAMLLSVVVVAGLVGRRRIAATMINRAAYGSILVGLLMQLALALGSFVAGMSAGHALAVQLLLWSGVTALLALVANWRLMLPVMAFLAGYLIASWQPSLTYPVMSAAHLVLAADIVWIWWARYGDDPLWKA